MKLIKEKKDLTFFQKLVIIYKCHCTLKDKDEDYKWSFIKLYLEVVILQRYDLVPIHMNNEIRVIILVFKNNIESRIEIINILISINTFDNVFLIQAIKLYMSNYLLKGFNECILFIDENNKLLIKQIIINLNFEIDNEIQLLNYFHKRAINKKVLIKYLKNDAE